MNKIKILLSSPLSLFMVTAFGLVLILAFTNPLELPLVVLLLPFLLFLICIRSLLLTLFSRLYREGSQRKVRFAATSGAAILLFLLILQSLGQLSWRDILLTLGLIGMTAFYFKKTDLI